MQKALTYEELLKIAFGVMLGRNYTQCRNICGMTEEQFARLKEQRGCGDNVGAAAEKWGITNRILNMARAAAGKELVPAESNPYIKTTRAEG